MENTDDYFSLKWSNFHSSLSEGFHDFFKEEAMVDVTLAAEGKFVQAHKLVLSVCSPYFKNLFKVNPCKHPIVILKDVGNSDLSYMLDFMYKGEVGVKHEDLPSFLKLAETLKIKGLAGGKIQKNEYSTKNIDSNSARIKKKISKENVSDVNQENREFQSCAEQSRKKILKNKKRRLSCKSEPVKKLKSEKCDDNSVNKCESIISDNVSEEEDNNPLIKFIGGDTVKSSEVLKQGESQYDNESESQCDNKASFSTWSDGVPDSEDSGGPDINSFFKSDYSEETEQTPQGNKWTRKKMKDHSKKAEFTCDSANLFLPKRHFKESRPSKDVQNDLIRHWPIWTRGRQRCKAARCKSKSKVMCQKCGVHLCCNAKNNCFLDFHTA